MEFQIISWILHPFFITCLENVEDLPRQPKYTNPCPWRGPYKGNHKGGRPKAAPLCGGGRRPPPLYGPLHGHGFVYLGCLGRSSTFLLRLCVISPMGFPMGPGSASSNSHLVLYNDIHIPHVGVLPMWPRTGTVGTVRQRIQCSAYNPTAGKSQWD